MICPSSYFVAPTRCRLPLRAQRSSSQRAPADAWIPDSRQRGFRNDGHYANHPPRQQAATSNQWRASCAKIAISKTSPAFSVTRKRRNSFPSETHVKRGQRVIHSDVELVEKLGRNDLCPCGSGRRFQSLLHEVRCV
ncbi:MULTISPECIES: SEC-C metal-binding domain-containing protein [unclassified Bradyrhizobium]